MIPQLIPALVVVIFHLITGIVEVIRSDRTSSDDELVQNKLTPHLNWIIPAVMLPLLFIPIVGKPICIVYLIWIITDTIQRSVKSPENKCEGYRDPEYVTFKIVFIIITALASLLLSYEFGNTRPKTILFSPVIIVLAFISVAWVSTIASGNDDPEKVIIEYMKGTSQDISGEHFGRYGVRLTILLLVLVGTCAISMNNPAHAGYLLVAFLLSQPILIRLVYSHECLFEEAANAPSSANNKILDTINCKLDKYGGVRTYMTMIWMCICCVIIKNWNTNITIKAVIVTMLIFITMGSAALVVSDS